MTIAYSFLIMAAASLGMLGIMHKVADHRRCRPEAINLFLFLGAAVVMAVTSLLRLGPEEAVAIKAVAWLTATVCGFLASVAILSFQHGVRFGKISTSWLIINLSTALPTVLSIVIYREAVNARRAVGLILAVVALLVLWLERVREEHSTRHLAGATRAGEP
jgi:uncharacterized membrane protein